MKNPSLAFYTFLVTLALALLGGGMLAAGSHGLAFGLFTTLTLGGSLVCIWERSVVRSAFSLMATFLGIAGLFLLLGADFLAMAQILIYVGGVLALLLFGVMLTPPDMHERQLPRVLGATITVILGVAFIGSRVLSATGSAVTLWAIKDPADLPPVRSHAREIGIGFVDPEGYMLAFELAAFFLTVALVAAVFIARRKRSDLQPEGQA